MSSAWMSVLPISKNHHPEMLKIRARMPASRINAWSWLTPIIFAKETSMEVVSISAIVRALISK